MFLANLVKWCLFSCVQAVTLFVIRYIYSRNIEVTNASCFIFCPQVSPFSSPCPQVVSDASLCSLKHPAQDVGRLDRPWWSPRRNLVPVSMLSSLNLVWQAREPRGWGPRSPGSPVFFRANRTGFRRPGFWVGGFASSGLALSIIGPDHFWRALTLQNAGVWTRTKPSPN